MIQNKQHNLKEATISWLSTGLDNKQISAELLAMGVDERNIPEMLREINKMRSARNTTRGMYLVLGGAILCLASCVITILSTHTSGMVLYGLTTLGLGIAMAGLYKIFF